MLAWSVRQLASKSKVSDSSIRRIGIGFGVPENVTLDLRARLQTYFESRGFVFMCSENLGAGVHWNRQINRAGKPARRAGDFKG